MKFADSVKQTASLTSTATIALGAATAGYRTLAQAIADSAGKAEQIAVGDTICMRVDDVTDPTKFEIADYTIGGTAQAPTLARTTIRTSSAGGTTPVTFGGPVTVLCTVPSGFLTGTPLPDYLSSNDAGTPVNTDMIALVRGTSLFGATLTAIASAINKLWPGVAESQVTISTTASFPLDFAVHNRRRLVCTATPAAITGPATFSSVGNGFACKISNLSGADIPLTGITVRPSGAVIPAGSSADVYATGGAVYADLYATAAAASAGTVPGAVTGLTAGTATDVTQPLTWTAPTTGTAPFLYKVEYKATTDTTWNTAPNGGSVSGTSFTVTGLTASTPYDYRVTPSNGTGPGTAATITSKSTAAAAPTETLTIGAISSPQTVGTAFTVSGTWAGVQPTGLNYALTDNGGAQGAFNTATGATINANGTWSFSQNPASASTSRTMVVQDSGHTGIVSAPSNAYVVNAAAAGGAAPFTVTSRAPDGVPLACHSYSDSANPNYAYTLVHPTGTATASAVAFFLTDSSSVRPDPNISTATTPMGKGVGASAGSGDVYYAFDFVLATSIPSAKNFYFWVRVVDSNGATWWFKRNTPVSIYDTATYTPLANSEVMVAG